MLEISIEIFLLYTTKEFKNSEKGYEWHHQRLKIFKNAFTESSEHISVDVGLMTFDKDSQSPFSHCFELFTLFVHWNGYDIKVCRVKKDAYCKLLYDLIVGEIDWK